MKTLAHFVSTVTVRQAISLLLIACLLHLNVATVRALDYDETHPDNLNANVTVTNPAGTGAVEVLGDKSILHWNEMNIDAGHTLTFTRDGGAFTVLNRDLQSNATRIDGSIIGNQGHIIIVNQNGIIFGPEAMVTAQKFTAAAMNIDNSEFLYQEGLRFFDAEGLVHNDGTIEVVENAALLGKHVLNTGTIRTDTDGFVVLAAADEIFLAESKDSDILVQLSMDSVESPASVTNRAAAGEAERRSGLIESPEGTIILAAGDLTVMALDNLGRLRASVDIDAAPPVINENTGIYDSVQNNTEFAGDVFQEGEIHADAYDYGATAGEVLMLAGDDVRLGMMYEEIPSQTTAMKVGWNGCGGFVEANGENLWLAGNVNTSSGQYTPSGTFEIENNGTITVANGARPADPLLIPENTIYERDIENYSFTRMNVVIKAEEEILLRNLADNLLHGYFGDMVFQTGAEGKVVSEDKNDTLFTEKCGDIIVIAGNPGEQPGVNVGNIHTIATYDNRLLDAGKIEVITTDGGDIATGYLKSERGREVEITAVSSGNLAIEGIDPEQGASVYARTSRPEELNNTTGKATVTLAAAGDIDVDSYIYAEANANAPMYGDSVPTVRQNPPDEQPALAVAKVRIYSEGATTITLPPEQLVQAVATVYGQEYYPGFDAVILQQEMPIIEAFADASVIICAKGGLTLNSDQEYPVQATATTPFDGTHAQSTGVENDENFGPNEQTHALVCVDCYEDEEGEAAPLYRPEEPRLSGCPLEMDAAAAELGIHTDQLRVAIGNSLTVNPSTNPCNACRSLVTAANTLQDLDGSRLEAMAHVFNQVAPPDMPFTPEMGAAIATAFAENARTDARYATAMEYIDAFVRYVTVVERDFGAPTGDPVTLAMEKYGDPLLETNPNMAAYVMMQIQR